MVRIFTKHCDGIRETSRRAEDKKKKQSMECRPKTYPRTKHFKAVRSAGELMPSIFLASECVIRIGILPQGETIHSENTR